MVRVFVLVLVSVLVRACVCLCWCLCRHVWVQGVGGLELRVSLIKEEACLLVLGGRAGLESSIRLQTFLASAQA